MGKLFISYAHEDRPFVAGLARALADQGHEVWWDRQLNPGAEYREQIQRELDAAELVIVAWSARSRLSRFVADEADQALSKDKLVPVVIDGARPALGFGAVHTIDLGAADDESFAALGRVIAERLASGPQPPPRRPPIRVAGAALGLGVTAGLAFGAAQSAALAARTLARGSDLVPQDIAWFGGQHAAIAFALALPVALFAGVRARGLGLSRFRAVARPFVLTLGIGFVVALTIGALALANGVSAQLTPAERAAELASIVLLAALAAAAILGGVRLVLLLTLARRPAG